ncbi:hypothetical protein HMPREF9057_00570 [Actinomyces sp. oral taxon 171 str. F0337]|nr:hypothetical protein HMPREF9057_00570 [Actinomyces sp. oral taxon 171 str. F0337]
MPSRQHDRRGDSQTPQDGNAAEPPQTATDPPLMTDCTGASPIFLMVS